MPTCLLGLMLLVASASVACGADMPQEEGVPVECCGKLRHGVVSVMGETTGTTITCSRVTWELNLPNEECRKFVKENDKQPVLVTGTLRKVICKDDRVRWVVDVKRLAVPKTASSKDKSKVTVKGILRVPNAVADNVAAPVLDADGFEWALDYGQNTVLETQARGLMGQPVEVQGHVEAIPGTRRPVQMKICVNKVTKQAAE